jgi:phosphatidylserine/phosphatidylglycerophosphate/cardiolipin synthase-like enzyme
VNFSIGLSGEKYKQIYMRQFIIITFIIATVLSVSTLAAQNGTYESPFQPKYFSNVDRLNLTAFFSPDHAADTLTSLVQSAMHDVEIAIPSFSSWIGCTYGNETQCYGCPPQRILEQETFPVFQALVEAIVNREVSVKILTNDPDVYGNKQCPGTMSLLSYLVAIGAQIVLYTSTNFMHSKYLSIDGRTVAISSVNFSKTSIMNNREAGIVTTHSGIVAFSRDVFQYDFSHGTPYTINLREYNATDIAYIRQHYPKVVVPETRTFNCEVKSPKPDFSSSFSADNVGIIASPDYAFDAITALLNSTKNSLKLSIYEVSSASLCDVLINLVAKGVNLQLFVSHEVYSLNERKDAAKCYKRLAEKNIKIILSAPKCLTYSHQKFWIIDDSTLVLSTGNWRDADYPLPPYIFPDTPKSKARHVNRDFTVVVNGKDTPILKTFQQVFDLDYSQGVPYTPQ